MVLYEKVAGGILRQHRFDFDMAQGSKTSRSGALDRRLEAKLDRLIQACTQTGNVIPLAMRANPSAFFENCTESEQITVATATTEEGDDMAREHRLRICIGVDDDGKQITKQISAKSELELGDAVVRALIKSGRLAEFIPEIYQQFEASKREPAPKKTNFRKYLEHWRQTYKTSGAANTQVFRDAKQSILLRAFGDTYIEDLRPDDIQRFLNERAKQVSKTTVKSDWGMLKEVLDSAVSDGIIDRNPAKDSRLHNPAPEGKGTSALTIEQLKSIQAAIPTLEDQRERCLIALLAFTSMRREEALGLRWENVDFEHNTLAIREAIVFPVNKPVLKETKTKSSERLFPMGEELRKILWDCKRESGYVIATKSGDPISSVTYRRIWDSLKSHIELYGASAMNFRTTFATMSVASGVDIRTTQALMGHSSPDLTLKVYTKTEPTRLPAAVEQMQNFLREA